MPEARTIPIVALDLTSTIRLVRSAAVAQAIAEMTQLAWKTYTDSKALSVIYTLLFWKAKPGWVEVDTGSQESTLRRAGELTAAQWGGVYLALPHGAAAVAQRLRAVERARGAALTSVLEKFASARAIDHDVLAFTRLAIRDLARIKLASDVVIEIAAPAAAGVSPAITVDVIRTIDKAASAKILLFAVGKEPAKDGVKQLAAKGSPLLAREAKGYLAALRKAELDILRQNDLLRRTSATVTPAGKAAGRPADGAARAGTARQRARFARAGQLSLGNLAWGFVAADLRDAWRDYVEAIGD
ncbi:MAG TPA: hypothetical protein VKD69_09335 [Vicinamibacterales bacterium]|nr:hypothetical protein [Vicinamibacterales bacterium]